MFWDKTYTPSQNIEALLEKENATVEEFLDDDDILQECKTLKKSIVKYFTRPDVIKRLVEIITTEPSDELPLAQRFRHANMACEILTLGFTSIDEKILSDPDTLNILYSYLENEPPLNPLLSSFFHKTFCMLFTKKLEQDWFLYQQMCLQLLEYLKSRKNFLDLIFRHFSTPVIPELVLQLLNGFEGGQIKRNLYEWLTEEKLVERLIAILGNPDECDKHSNVTEFLCDLIKQGRTMRQTEHENDSFEPAFDGSNPILKTIESEASIIALLNVILEPNAQESAIVSGISVVLTLIKPHTLIEETYSDRSKFIQNREKEISEQITTTVIRVMAPRLNELNQLLKTPPHMPPINTTAAKLEPPFGNTRLQVCRVFTVLLQTKNEEIAKAICETDFFDTLLNLFKHYCWNNFLHSEVEKCMQIIFESSTFNNNNNSAQSSTIAHDGSISKSSNNGDINGGAPSSNFFDCMNPETNSETVNKSGLESNANNDKLTKSFENKHVDIKEAVQVKTKKEEDDEKQTEQTEQEEQTVQSDNEIEHGTEVVEDEFATSETKLSSSSSASLSNVQNSLINEMKQLEETATDDNSDNSVEMNEATIPKTKTVDIENESKINFEPEKMDDSNEEISFKEKDKLKNPTDIGPSALQRHLIVKCNVITRLIDCWQHNHDMENAEKGRRLGYMGHLIKTLKHITNCISESDHIGALIESNLSDENEIKKWQTITNAKDGDLTKVLAVQNRLLANCNAHEACDFGHLAKDFLSDNSTWEYIMSSNMLNNLGGFTDSDLIENNHDAVLTFVEDEEPIQEQFNMFQFDNNLINNFEIDDDDDDDELAGAVGGIGSGGSCGSGSGSGSGSLGLGADGGLLFFGKNTKSTNLPSLGVSSGMCSNPWYDVDPFANLKPNAGNTSVGPWSSEFDHDNFADFETHFSSFTSDLGESLTAAKDGDIVQKGSDSDATDIGNVEGDQKINSAAGIDLAAKEKSQEYDNNANVDKSAISIDLFNAKNKLELDKDDDDDDIVPPSLVRTLQSVMQESEDDYEDDEGMWTKPLGPSVNNETFNMESDENSKSSPDDTLVNGINPENSADKWSAQAKNELKDANNIDEGDLQKDASTKSLRSLVLEPNSDTDMNDIVRDVKKAKTAIDSDDARTSPTTTT